MNTVRIPAPIQRYLDADAGMNTEQFASCFTTNAQVQDEGKTIHGVEAVTEWKVASRKKYNYQVEPLSASHDGDTVLLKARVTGDFEGSPVELAYRFVLEGERIAELVIQ